LGCQKWIFGNSKIAKKKKKKDPLLSSLGLAWLGLALVLGFGFGYGFPSSLFLVSQAQKVPSPSPGTQKSPPQQKVPGKQHHIPPSNRLTIPTKCPPLRRSTRKRWRWRRCSSTTNQSVPCVFDSS